MTTTSPQTARSLAAATPAGRDRYADFLRVFSIAVVVTGHWLMAVVTVRSDGRVSAGNALTSVPALQYATWLLQVMPLFFFVGGFAHYTALQGLHRRGGSYADFVQARVTRLLRPTVVFVAMWLAAALALEVTGRQTGVFALAVRAVAQPLWFLGVYLGVMALAPIMLRWHRRHGALVPVLLGVAAVGVDVVAFGLQVPALRALNIAVVWLAVHQLGYLYADGTLLARRRIAVAMVLGGLGTVVALTASGTYPVSMVGMPGEPVSNMNPPTVALLAHAVWLIGLAVLLREPVGRWLQSGRMWTVVIAANGVVMTVFLWHLTALFVAYGLWLGHGGSLPAAGSALWWQTRPAWLAGLALICLLLVVAFRRAERPRLAPLRSSPPGRPARSALAAVGAAACCLGVLGLSATGFGGILAGRSVTLVVLPMTAPLAVALVLGGWTLLSPRPSSAVPLVRSAGGGRATTRSAVPVAQVDDVPPARRDQEGRRTQGDLPVPVGWEPAGSEQHLRPL